MKNCLMAIPFALFGIGCSLEGENGASLMASVVSYGFECGNGEFVQGEYVCDGTADCTNGRDEARETCFLFDCGDGEQVPENSVCDDSVDCKNGRDESAALCFDYVDNNCHDFANKGVCGGADGIVSCQGHSQGPHGHTLNYLVVEQESGFVCLYEPQNGATCCFYGWVSDEGRPDLSVDEGMECMLLMCNDQYQNGQEALPPGQLWETDYLDCEKRESDATSCYQCCDENAGMIPDQWGASAIVDRESYRIECRAECTQAFSCSDFDSDGICDDDDPCPYGDDDGDGTCNEWDICPAGPDEADMDWDGTPDACDPYPNCASNADSDSDGICDDDDPCPYGDWSCW